MLVINTKTRCERRSYGYPQSIRHEHGITIGTTSKHDTILSLSLSPRVSSFQKKTARPPQISTEGGMACL